MNKGYGYRSIFVSFYTFEWHGTRGKVPFSTPRAFLFPAAAVLGDNIIRVLMWQLCRRTTRVPPRITRSQFSQ